MLAMKTAVDESVEPVPSTSSARKRPHVTEEITRVKKPRLDQKIRKSIGNTFVTIPILVTEDIDMNEFLNSAKDEIREKISEELNERNAPKFYLNMKTQLSRTSTDGEEQIATPYFCSIPKIILHSTDIEEEIGIASDRIKELLSTHEGQGSGFKLDTILDCQLHVASYDRIGGSSYIPLPKYIQNKNATINIKNVSDDNCFQYSMLYTKYQPENHPYRPEQYKKHLGELDMSGIRTPVEITQLKKFEKQNREYSVNVYALDSSKEKSRDNKVIMFPLYITKELNRKYHANLLLVTSGDKRHYVVIKNLSRLLAGRTAGKHTMYICKYCLYSFEHEDAMKAHEVSCSEHAAVTSEYPVEPMNILKFKDYGHTLEVPFTIYADFESILEEVDDDESKSTQKINKHVPCGFSCLTTSSCEQYNREEVVVYSGRDCMTKFFQHINSEQLRINKILNEIVPMKELTPQQVRDYRNAKTCYNCGVEFSADQDDENRAKNIGIIII